jgi:predicted ATP-dependent protease
MESRPPFPLAAEQLTARLDPASLGFADTTEVPAYTGVLGQARACAALAFGVAMERPGYHIFVMGEAGVGRLSLTRQFLEQQAKQRETPADIVYLHDFADAYAPAALLLPSGRGASFAADMACFVDTLLASFPAALEHPALQRRKAEIERAFSQSYTLAIDAVEQQARAQGIALFREGETISFAPLSAAGEPLSEEAFAALSHSEQEAFHRHVAELEQALTEALLDLPQWKRETALRLRQAHQEACLQAAEPLLQDLAGRYADQPGVLRYVEAIRNDLPRLAPESMTEGQAEADEAARRSQCLQGYAPNVLVAHAPGSGAPVMYEANPSYANLFGRIQRGNEQAAPIPPQQMIRPGALHQANGGYLLLDADKLLSEEQAWPALKRALQTQRLAIEASPQEQAAAVAPNLNPQAIPLRLKLVLIGERELYYSLQSMDEEFNELFQVLADFDEYFPRDAESVLLLIRLIKQRAPDCAALTAAAAARLVDYSGRLAEHQQRLSARISDVLRLAAEAEWARRQAGAARIDACHVAQALAARQARQGRIAAALLEEMLAGALLIEAQGAAVGCINGLTVLEAGGSRLGIPARITATVSPGGRGVIDIEREARLGQAIHSKGVLILSGYLAHQYAHDAPLAISAYLALEQSYGYVDGDSAALAEALALISALADLPLRQCLAVTGSINQYGAVQAVGGVNEKIEGFFRLCQAQGLSGEQGVIIPRANSLHLMLEDGVVAAAQRGAFSIYAVATVDEALSLLTGKPAGIANRKVAERLRAMARHLAHRQDLS